jgi:hypothetical protein
MQNNIVVRLVTYYVSVIVFTSGLFHLFPILGEYIARERGRQGARGSLELGGFAESVPVAPGSAGTMQLLDPETSVPILLSLVFALLVALPVVWVYRWTRPRNRYNQAFAHTLLVVPIAITLVVFLAKGSLALAFSLAGIVAAVRFRTSLDDSMDAVYVFIVIGTGLAAGVQLLAVAVIASMLFNAVALTVWRMNFGSKPAVLRGWQLAELAPEGQHADGDAAEERHDPFNARLRLHATQLEQARHFVIPFLEERVKKWQIAEVTPQEDGTSIIEFNLRIKKSTDLAAFIHAIEQGDPHVSKVELTKLESKKHKNH